MSFSIPRHGVIHPLAEVRAGGWTSSIDELRRYGWVIEYSEVPMSDRLNIYFRNPSKNMVGSCYVDYDHIQNAMGREGILLYLDEQILLEMETSRQIHMPSAELFELDVGKPMRSVDTLQGDNNDWVLYTADKQRTEIIVTPEKIPMLLAEIRKAQEPRAKEIIHSQHRREYQKLEAKATILSFA